jgi:UDP-glucose 4-epimerase
MKIVITGGAGFVGSHIVEALTDRGDEVLVIDDLSTGKRANLSPEIGLEVMGIGDERLAAVLADFGPDAIVHAAAQASVPTSVKTPDVDARINIVDGLNVMAAAVGAGVSRFVYINTGGALYGEPDYVPCDEAHPVRPISPYGLSKATLEAYLAMLLPKSVSLTTLRLANVYGPRQDPHGEAGVVAIFTERMMRDDEMTIFGDGEQTRDFVYVRDVASAVVAALSVPLLPGGRNAVNIGTGVPTSVNQVFRALAASTGYGREPGYQAARDGDVRHIYLDVAHAASVLNWRPTVGLEEGLKVTVESFAE